ncbi:hypothetical protein BGW80DRAFT_1460181 [Lactifluus volemus]|nr:hypothetical protein BGW80DRAFT_1460181 [Lactifluus volemus]
MSNSSMNSYHTPARIDPIYEEILHIVTLLSCPLPILKVKKEEENIPHLFMSPPVRELSATPESFHKYNHCNPNDYTFTLKDLSGEWVCVEFVKDHLDHDDSIIKGLTVYGKGPYEAPLTMCALVWGCTSTLEDKKLIANHNLFKQTVDNALNDLGNPGLKAEVG